MEEGFYNTHGGQYIQQFLFVGLAYQGKDIVLRFIIEV
jgi:hypothetical protein